MSRSEQLELAEKRIAIAEKERDMWRTRAEALSAKLMAYKKRASEEPEPEPKKSAPIKHCSECGVVKSECKKPLCQQRISEKRAAKAAKAAAK
jgi:hypothetical protein